MPPYSPISTKTTYISTLPQGQWVCPPVPHWEEQWQHQASLSHLISSQSAPSNSSHSIMVLYVAHPLSLLQRCVVSLCLCLCMYVCFCVTWDWWLCILSSYWMRIFITFLALLWSLCALVCGTCCLNLVTCGGGCSLICLKMGCMTNYIYGLPEWPHCHDYRHCVPQQGSKVWHPYGWCVCMGGVWLELCVVLFVGT